MFLEDVTPPEPGWWTYIAWGTVPDWVAAIGTVGTLAIALAILLADRRKESRRQADGFVTWYTITSHHGNMKKRSWTLDVFAHNATDSPIPVGAIRSRASVEPNFIKPLSETEEVGKPPRWDIHPGQQTITSIPLDSDPRSLQIVVDFRDSHGVTWHRDLFSGKYMSERKFTRFRQLGKKDRGKFRDPAAE